MTATAQATPEDSGLVHAIDSLLLRLLTLDADETPPAVLASPEGRGLQAALDADEISREHHRDIAALVASAVVNLGAGDSLEARQALISARHLARGRAPRHHQPSPAA